MDSYALREEFNTLQKEVTQLRHVKEVMDARLKEMHIEEIKYLEEIPIYKKRSDDAKNNYLKLEAQSVPLKKELEGIINELKKVRSLVIEEEKALDDIRNKIHDINNECSIKKLELSKIEKDLKLRQELVTVREADCNSRDAFHRKLEFDLDKRDVEISKKELALEHSHNDLHTERISHESNVRTYDENVRSLTEQRKFLEEDKQLIKDKLAKADKLIKDHCDLKAQLLLQADKMSKAVRTAEDKQIMLDKALTELTNQENTLKIKDLKIRKMAHDAGLQKELKELEASIR